ncbi:MAG: hypothetical protein N3C12_00090 [Candidatus Binatia bacterium]|nr:hypothetical protein [Candidatus Binatia bacterium]
MNRSSLTWSFTRGPARTFSDFGDPVSGSTSYALCLYDDRELKVAAWVEPSASLWTATRTAYRYRDPWGSNDGFQRAVLRAGAAGRSSIKVSLGGALAQLPKAIVDQALWGAREAVVVQLHQSDGACYESPFAPNNVRRLSER